MAEEAYFDRFPSFVPDQRATLMDNFDQLAVSNGWAQNSRTHRKERKMYMMALADAHIGSIERGGAAEKLAGLQSLCGELGVSPIPTSIKQCKKRLGEEVQVCIIDLIDSRRLGGRVRTFRSHPELQEHIKTKKHYFPKDLAKEEANGLLKVLLRMI